MANSINNVSIVKSASCRRLLPAEIAFTQFSFDREQRVAFLMDNVFSAGEILGMPLSSGDRVRFTARYDMLHLRASPTLEVVITSAGGKEYLHEYLLTNDERRIFAEKMEAFFLRQTGLELRAFCMEARSGQTPVPPLSSGKMISKEG